MTGSLYQESFFFSLYRITCLDQASTNRVENEDEDMTQISKNNFVQEILAYV